MVERVRLQDFGCSAFSILHCSYIFLYIFYLLLFLKNILLIMFFNKAEQPKLVMLRVIRVTEVDLLF